MKTQRHGMLLFLLGLITALLRATFYQRAHGPFGTPGGCDEWHPPPCARCLMELVSAEIRRLIRRMAAENPTWGEERIADEPC